jgi:hypothetical protein
MNHVYIQAKEIRQVNNQYSLNDIHKSSGQAPKHQPNRFLRLQQTRDLITEIEHYPYLGSATSTKNGGKNRGSFACKELVYAYAMWISPKFHLHVIRAFDGLTCDNKKQLPAPDPDDVILPREYVELLYKRVNDACVAQNDMVAAFNRFQKTVIDTQQTFIRLNGINDLLKVSKI